MDDFSEIINWNNVFTQSKNFQTSKPCKFAFIENFFHEDFYKKLHDSYPKFDDNWDHITTYDKNHWSRKWAGTTTHGVVRDGDDNSLSSEWNILKKYASTKEFSDNFKKFTNVAVEKLKHFHFIGMSQGGFQLPHAHNIGPSTLVMMLYFSKDWNKGDPGATYIASDLDESSIIFEPYNLDNTLVIFQDSQYAIHGARYLEKDVKRKALQITLEGWSHTSGWSGGDPDKIIEERSKNLVEL